MVIFRDFPMKMQIKEALGELLEQRLMNDVTVSDICEKANISRQTFYNNFSDKFAVPQWFFDLICHRYLYETGRSLSFSDAFLLNTQALQQNKHFLARLSKPKGYQSLFAYGRRARKQTLLETVRDYKHIAVTKELENMIEYHVQGETQLICIWAENGMESSAQYLTDLIMEATPRKLLGVLKDPTPGVKRSHNENWLQESLQS